MQNEQPPLGIGENPKIRLKTFLIFMQALCRRIAFPPVRGGVFGFFKKFFKKVLTFSRKRDTLCLALGDQEC